MSSGSSSPQALLQAGFHLLQQGRPEAAWDAFHAVLRLDPANALAHHMVGLIALQAGQPEMGVDSLRRSIALNPDDPVAYGNLASGLRDLGRTDEALHAYAQALALAPGFVDALNNRAILHARLGQGEAALADYDRALAIEPRRADLHNNRAETMRALGRREEALAGYDRAVALDPASADAAYNRANLLAELRRREEAVQEYRRALELRPGFVEALVNLGNLLVELDRQAEALACYDQALALQADLGQALSNRANVLRVLGRHAEALESCDIAIRLDPAFPDPLHNRATILGELGRLEEAVAAYEACAALQPDLADATFNCGTAYLALGDYARGWERYEARFRMTRNRFVADRGFPQPYWRGDRPVGGKTILLHTEQGLGDSLQFCRYADRLKAAGAARVILEVEKPLVRLLSTLAGADLVLEKDAELPRFDLHASLMSLPWAFRTTLDTVPAEVPYLHADPQEARRWAERLGPRRRPRVGLVWSGGFRPEKPELWDVNRRRNVPLAMLAPLAHADVDFVSLQKGEPAASEWAELRAQGWEGPAMADFTAELHDFADTAALVQNLDLVIAVDTSTTHLAGALGKPVWLLNRFDTCWRWMRERTDSPWYPTLRLFRQKSFGDWGPVVEDAAAALKTFAG